MDTKSIGFLKSFHGQNSCKRLAGSLLVAQGALMKLILFLYTLTHKVTEFDKLDSCADSLIYTGAALIGAGLAELLRKK